MRVGRDFLNQINLMLAVQSCPQKYSPSRFTQIKSISAAVPAHRGAFRDRHGRWARDAVDAAASGARIARGRMTLDLRTAKSCGPDAPTLASSLRDFPKATVAKEPGHRGARSKPLKPLRRESWVFR